MPGRSDQLTETLRSQTGQVDLLVGVQLPSEQAMAARFRLSRTVIREAVAQLKADGLADAGQGRVAMAGTSAAQHKTRRCDEIEAALLAIDASTRNGADFTMAIAAEHRGNYEADPAFRQQEGGDLAREWANRGLAGQCLDTA